MPGPHQRPSHHAQGPPPYASLSLSLRSIAVTCCLFLSVRPRMTFSVCRRDTAAAEVQLNTYLHPSIVPTVPKEKQGSFFLASTSAASAERSAVQFPVYEGGRPAMHLLRVATREAADEFIQAWNKFSISFSFSLSFGVAHSGRWKDTEKTTEQDVEKVIKERETEKVPPKLDKQSSPPRTEEKKEAKDEKQEQKAPLSLSHSLSPSFCTCNLLFPSHRAWRASRSRRSEPPLRRYRPRAAAPPRPPPHCPP